MISKKYIPALHTRELKISASQIYMYKIPVRNVLMTNEMYNSYNQFLFHIFLSDLHVSNESSRSSSGALHNVPIVPNCVIQYIMLCSW